MFGYQTHSYNSFSSTYDSATVLLYADKLVMLAVKGVFNSHMNHTEIMVPTSRFVPYSCIQLPFHLPGPQQDVIKDIDADSDTAQMIIEIFGLYSPGLHG